MANPEIIRILSAMLGMAEVDQLDDKSNEWRSVMIDAREALDLVKQEK